MRPPGVRPRCSAGSELTLADDVECFWLPGGPAPSAAPAASALSRLDSAASEVLPVSSQAPGFLGDTCTREPGLPLVQAVWTSHSLCKVRPCTAMSCSVYA